MSFSVSRSLILNSTGGSPGRQLHWVGPPVVMAPERVESEPTGNDIYIVLIDSLSPSFYQFSCVCLKISVGD